MWRSISVGMVALVLAAATPARAQRPAAPVPGSARSGATWEPYTLRLTDSTRIEAERGRLRVPERRGAPGSRAIELGLVRLRSTAAKPGNPVLFLGGSPGGLPSSRLATLPGTFPLFARLREHADVVLLDYRGVGLSTPRLRCPAAEAMPVDVFESRESALEFFLGEGRRCAARMKEEGVDLGGYNWAEVAEDVEDVRRALGAERLDLVGFSSGTHAALAAIRAHEAGIGRAVLIGTEGPDHTRKLPLRGDRQLRVIGELARRDEQWRQLVPDFPGLVRQVLERLEREPVEVEVRRPGTGERIRGRVGRFALEYVTAKSLSGPEEFASLLPLYLSLSRGDTRVLSRVMQSFVDRPPPNPLSYVMDGASGASAQRQARIGREAARSVLGNAVNFPFPEAAGAWGYPDLGPAFRAPARGRLPVLFVTGELDGNTPPEQAEEVRRGFPDGSHLVVSNAGHAAVLDSPAVGAALVEFLRGKDVSAAKLALPWNGFPPPRR